MDNLERKFTVDSAWELYLEYREKLVNNLPAIATLISTVLVLCWIKEVVKELDDGGEDNGNQKQFN